MTFFAGSTVHEPGKAAHEVSYVDNTVSRTLSVPPGQSSQHSLLQRPGSISSWVKNILPSHRPERGGTARKRGYWEQSDTTDLPMPRTRKRFSDSHQSLISDAGHPDRLTRWNTAKDVSQSDTDAMPPLTRAVSAGHARETSRGSQRQWNWLPQEFRRKARAAEVQDAADAPEPSAALSVDLPVEAAPDTDAAGMAEESLMKAQELMDSKKKARLNRRSLKQSGDYLGVQGINPDTGELDIITPTDSDGSSITFDKEQKLEALRDKLRQAREDTKQTAMQTACEAQGIIQELESESRHSTNREAIKKLHKAVKWRRQTKQWSSAQEPNLSPIAQSRRSTLPASPESPQPDTPRRITSSPAPLIDLGSPEIMGLTSDPTSNSLGEISSRRSSASTVESRGTVVRTPYRQSLADVSCAALELFENGISFDRFRGVNKARSDERSIAKVMSRLPKTQTIEDLTDHDCHETLECAIESTEARASSPKVSFSERGLGRQAESMSLCSRPEDVSLTHPFVPSPRDISNGTQVTQGDRTTPSSGQDRTERRLGMIQKTFESLKASSPMNQDIKACPDSGSKGRQKWLPQIRQRMTQTEKLQQREPRAQRQQSQALQSVTDLTRLPMNAIASNLNVRPSVDGRLTREGIPTNLRCPARGSQKPDAPHLETYQRMFDEDWTSMTMREIAKCGKLEHEQDQYVSTHTTIITGSDQVMSPSPRNPGENVVPETPSSHSKVWSPAVSTNQTKGTNTETLSSLSKIGLSTPPSSASKIHAGDPDTTLVEQVQGLEARVATIGGHTITTTRRLPVTTEQDTQLTSTSTLREICASDAKSRQRQSCTQPKGAKELQALKFEPDKVVSASLTAALPRAMRSPREKRIQALLAQMPGSYPYEEGEDVATVALFRSFVHYLQGIRVPRAVLKLVTVACLTSLEVVKMYISAVGPIVHARSELWARHASCSLTWQDTARILLAAPGVVLAMTALVEAMNVVGAVSTFVLQSIDI